MSPAYISVVGQTVRHHRLRFWMFVLTPAVLVAVVLILFPLRYREQKDIVLRDGKASIRIGGSRIFVDDGEGHTLDLTARSLILQQGPESGVRLGTDGLSGGEVEIRAPGAKTKVVRP